MKARTIISISLISGLAAVAQTAPPSQKVAPDTSKSPFGKPAVTQQAKPAAKPAVTHAPATTKAKPAMSTAKPMTAQKKAPAAAKPASQPAAKPAAMKAPVAKQAGKRDPFISPVREVGPNGPGCSTGKKCLAIDSIKLIGIVRAQTGSIALVGSSTTPFTYFLRESDPVFNGYVVKITATSIVFRENVIDRMGKTSTRDIIRSVSAPPV